MNGVNFNTSYIKKDIKEVLERYGTLQQYNIKLPDNVKFKKNGFLYIILITKCEIAMTSQKSQSQCAQNVTTLVNQTVNCKRYSSGNPNLILL